MIRISIVIPVGEATAQLEDCISSVLNQSFRDFELLIIEDGVDKKCHETILSVIKDDDRVSLIACDTHRGVSHARNIGINNAKGKYIYFLDSDDIIYENTLLWLSEIAANNDCDSIIFSSDVEGISTQQIPEWVLDCSKNNDKIYDRFCSNVFQESGVAPFIWLHFIKLDLLREHNLRFDENLAIGEDNAFIRCYLPLCNNTLLFSSRKLHCYNFGTSGSLFAKYSYDLFSKVKIHLDVINSVATFWDKLNFMGKEKSLLDWSIDFIIYDFNLLSEQEKNFIAIKLKEILKDLSCKDLNYMQKLKLKYMLDFIGNNQKLSTILNGKIIFSKKILARICRKLHISF